MLSKAEAAASAKALLQEEYGADLTTPDGEDVLLVEDNITDYGLAWLVPYNSRTFLTTGDPFTGLLPGACLIPKDEPERAHFPPTYLPTEEYVDKVRSGEMTWSR